MFVAFMICYFLSLEAIMHNPAAGQVAHVGSVVGMVCVAWDGKHGKQEAKKKESKK